MSSSDRRGFLLLAAAAALAGCGFTPAYGPGSAARGLQGRVRIDAPEDKDGFDFVARLEERLGRPGPAAYGLSYRIETEAAGLAIAPDNAIIRYQLSGRIEYRLRDLASDRVLSEGVVRSFTAYSASGTPVETAASEADAHHRLMRILADQIVTRLIATAPSWAAA
ncbi:LPS assembly lipoprotein LptE [Albidovulum sp.]